MQKENKNKTLKSLHWIFLVATLMILFLPLAASDENTTNITIENQSLNFSLENFSIQNSSIENVSIENVSITDISVDNTPIQNSSIQNSSIENITDENSSPENNSPENTSLEDILQVNTSIENVTELPEIELNDTQILENITACQPENCTLEDLENTSIQNLSLENLSFEFQIEPEIFALDATPRIQTALIYPTTSINAEQNEWFNFTVNVSCLDANCGEINVTLDPETDIYNFTTCGATGKNGPSQASCNTTYTGTALEGLVAVGGGIQNWTVPSTGTYTIKAQGASGVQGGATSGSGGEGTLMIGDFDLTQGEVIQILVGQKGSRDGTYGGGGGGGSFVIDKTNNDILVIAGGGGGASIRGSTYTNGRNASLNATGVYGSIDSTLDSNAPGTNGNGGASSTNGGGGGGGYIGNGAGFPAGLSFVNGGTGGTGNAGSSFGGFGGGAGGYGGGGGGGGYNGGGAGGYGGNGGGGGGGSSVNNGTNQNNTIGTAEIDGYVLIEFSGSVKGGRVSTNSNATPFYTNGTNPTTISLNAGQSSIITWFVNATGDIDIPFEFFAYSNQTSNMSNNNESERLNITIIDTTAPIVSITYPVATTYNSGVSVLNYTYIETNAGSCWNSIDNGATNSSPVSGGTNFSEISSSEGENSWTVYCNDSSGNEHFDVVNFTKNIPRITLDVVTPSGNVNVTKDEFFSVEVTVGCENANCGEINVTLDPVTIYNFTTCGASGRLGPSYASCVSTYSGTTLEGLVNVSGGIQNWTVPSTGTYVIEVFGAQGGMGGSSAGNKEGGLGARMKGSFDLTEGQVLQILVGQEGGDHATYGGGGGGGSFVANGSNYSVATPLIVAGGGGGGGVIGIDASNATDQINGRDGAGSSPGTGGINGSGGVSDTSYGGGGGGFYSSGSAGVSSGRGFGFRQGGAGATQRTGGMPGFGGGAAAHGGAGGGGGYSGGGGGDWSNAGFGGGAGSFNNGNNQDNSPAAREGSGYVTITSSGAKGGTVSTVVGTTPFYTNVTNPYNITLNENQTTSITWYVNASGDVDSSYEFFVYANQTADPSINNETNRWNVSIVSFNVTTLPSITITTPTSNSFTTNSGLDVNFTTGASTNSCWYSYDDSTNTSLPGCQNITSLTWSEGEHNITIWVNDSEGQVASRSVVFTLDTLFPSLSVVSPENASSTLDTSLNITFNASDVNLDSCWYSNDSMSLNTTLSGCQNITSVTWVVGSHNVSIWANDSAGNVNSTSISFTITPPDVTAPNITILAPSNDSIYSDVNLNITFTATDTSLDSCWYNNGSISSNTSLSNCANITTITWSQGDHNISIFANDSTGNVNSSQVFFTIDSLNPTIAFQTNTTAAGYHSQTFIEVNLTASDSHLGNITAYLYNESELISSYTTTTSPLNVTFYGLLEGTHYLNATVNDAVGNVNSTQTRIIILDTTTPQTTITSPINNLNTTASTAEFTFSHIDVTNTSCTLYMDQEGFIGNVSIDSNASVISETATSLTASNLDNRTYSWFIKCVDLAGNTNSTAIRTLTVDQVPPALTITTPSADATLGQLIYVRTEIVETLTRVDQAWFSMLNTTNPSQVLHSGTLNASTLWDSSWNTSIYSNAEWTVTFSVYANDSLGNTANQNVSFFVDNVNPIIQLIAPPASILYYKENFSLEIPVQDATLNYTHYNISKAGTIWQENSTVYETSVILHDWNDEVNVSEMEDGTYNLSVYAEDESGNSRISSTLFIVDKTAPVIVMNSPSNNTYFNVNNLTFNWSVTDAISTNMSCDLLVDDSVITSDISCINNTYCDFAISGFSSATHSWNVSCSDDASNQGSTSQNFVVDSLLPGINFAFPSLSPGNYSHNYIFVNISVSDVNLNTTIIRLYNSSGALINSSTGLTSSLFLNVTDLADGNYTLNASVNDSSGNTQSTSTRAFLLDTTLPSLNIITPQNSSKSSSVDVDVNFTAFDARIDSCWYSNDSMSTNTSLSNCANITTPTWTQGQHNITIWANDSVGNVNNVNVTFTVDTLPPSLSIVSPNNGSISTNTSLDVLFTSFDVHVDSCWYSNDSMSTNTSLSNCANITTPTWTQGQHNITIWANDTFGNTNSSNVSFTIDTLSPSLSIVSPSNDSVSFDADLNVTFVVVDPNLDSCWYITEEIVSDTILPSCVNLTDATWLAGEHNVTLWANDSVGNINSTNVTFTIVTPDTTPPSLSLIAPNNNSYSSNVSLDVTYTVLDTNLDSCWYSNDSMSTNTSLSNCANITTPTWTQGQHNITIWANDTFGNTNNVNTTFAIDLTNPTVTLISPIPEGGDGDGSIDFTYNVTDSFSLSNCSLVLNGNVNQSNSSAAKDTPQTFSLAGLNLGEHNWSVSCIDMAENQGNSLNRSLTIINSSEFGGDTTDFGSQNMSNIPNLTLDAPSYGKIVFSESIQLRNVSDLNRYVNISFNKIVINSSLLPELNKSARLTLYDIPYTDVTILKDDSECPSSNCTLISYSGGTLIFDVTEFSTYSANGSISSESTPTSNGGGGHSNRNNAAPQKELQCTSNDQCLADESCYENQCVKLFDVKILALDSSVEPNEEVDFTYFLKGMAEINNDVAINFWIEKDGEIISSGLDTVYFGSYEEKTDSSSLLIPRNTPAGSYELYVQVTVGNYVAQSHRTIQVSYPDHVTLNWIGSFSSKTELNFSLEAISHGESATQLRLEERLLKEDELIWENSRELVLNGTKIIHESISTPLAGSYRLEIVGYYNNQTSLLIQEFNLEDRKIPLWDIIIIILLILICIGVYRKREHVAYHAGYLSDKIKLTRRKLEPTLHKLKHLSVILKAKGKNYCEWPIRTFESLPERKKPQRKKSSVVLFITHIKKNGIKKVVTEKISALTKFATTLKKRSLKQLNKITKVKKRASRKKKKNKMHPNWLKRKRTHLKKKHSKKSKKVKRTKKKHSKKK